jgi:hypothetical protein
VSAGNCFKMSVSTYCITQIVSSNMHGFLCIRSFKCDVIYVILVGNINKKIYSSWYLGMNLTIGQRAFTRIPIPKVARDLVNMTTPPTPHHNYSLRHCIALSKTYHYSTYEACSLLESSKACSYSPNHVISS